MYFLRSMTFFRKYLSAQKRNALLWCFFKTAAVAADLPSADQAKSEPCLCLFALFAADM